VSRIVLLLAPIALLAAPPPIQPTFFGIDQNSIHSPWPPTTGAGTRSPAAALRLWDDGEKWSNIETCDAQKSAGFLPTDPNNPCYTWTTLDSWVRTQAPAAGMDVLYTLGATPGFATSQVLPKTACETAGPYSCLAPLDVDQTPGSGKGDGSDATWINFLTALVTRYKGQINFYELWNEPDSANFWSGTDAQFTRMMNDAAATIRSLDPAARILSPSFHGPTAATWFTTYLANGGAANFDIVNFHGRGAGATNAEAESILTTYAAAESVITSHGLSDRPFWDDEAGWLEDQVLDPDLQAAYVARLYILHASLGFPRFYWYQWDSPTPYGLQGTIAGTAYAQVASWLAGSTIGSCTPAGSIYSCPVTPASGDQDLILWDTSQSCASGVCTSAAYAVGSEYPQYLDVTGKTTPIQNNSVPIGAKPILLQSAGGSAPTPTVAITAVTNAASNLSGSISPGEIVTLYGSGLGPAQLVSAAPGADGLFDPQLDGVTVSFNGVAAPILYASASQLAAIVPYATSGTAAGGTAQVVAAFQREASSAFSATIAPTSPGVFTADSSGQGQAAALNSDGSPNSSTNPAHIGDEIVLFATGAGQTTPPGIDGKPAMPVYPRPVQSIQVAIGGKMATIDYAGGAPGEVAGLLQVNVEIPAGVPSGAVPVVIQIGGVRSQNGVTIAVQAAVP
jgi:uncharacterized protein (TIGR03437 family)